MQNGKSKIVELGIQITAKLEDGCMVMMQTLPFRVKSSCSTLDEVRSHVMELSDDSYSKSSNVREIITPSSDLNSLRGGGLWQCDLVVVNRPRRAKSCYPPKHLHQAD